MCGIKQKGGTKRCLAADPKRPSPYSLTFRLTLLRTHQIPNQCQVLRSLSLSPIPLRFNPNHSKFPINPSFRHFSSEPVLVDIDSDHTLIVDIFSKPRDLDDVKKQLDSNNVSISHDAVNAVLRKLQSDPDSARRFFRWVSENHPEKLSSRSYNAMLGVLGINGVVEEFWDLVGVMKKKGYGVSKWVNDRVLESFEKAGLDGEVVKLKGLFDKETAERKVSNLCRIVRRSVWSDDVEKEISDLNVGFSSELVKLVLESLGSEPNKVLIFFRWVEESGLFKHDECTYNAMVRVLGREDTIDRFWKVVAEMRSAGFEMEVETFVKALGWFCKRRMIKDAVELYAFALAGANKPTPTCFTFLLRKAISSKELDMDLFSRVLKVFTGNGSTLIDSIVDAVLKSLTTVGRIGEWNKVLKEMEYCGFVASGSLRSKIAFRLGVIGKKEQANEFVDRVEAYGSSTDHKIHKSLVEGHCVGGNLDKAFDSFKEEVGGSARMRLLKVRIGIGAGVHIGAFGS
ncbi:pentatricopeptide repeat-containing protein At5g15980, mitochondrial [Lathyrus oleraceus]|uniref:pentatricopeptide repeat-containing protein At5g15980, mitochondrial n=1 Tax=Pisum sativum TaxID=3888 RepID=UPI0021D2F04D|nr:pentatricopeptide repeat-containing protein At5g15980, mitochondrial-like [Pisum sativum]